MKFILFYEVQWFGKFLFVNRILWWGDFVFIDYGDNGEDLIGGWYDGN